MKITIITVCFNSEKTLADTINSVNSQTYKNIEHIFIDGGSSDKTLNILNKNPNRKKKILIKKKTSIYEAMNEGIKKATGNFIQILNSDDILYSDKTIENTVKKIKKYPKCNIFLGNVVYFSNNNFYKIKRYFKANKERIYNLLYGDMPPHPASFINKRIYKECGLYNTNYKIASDYDFFLRILKKKKSKFKILDDEIVKMRTGGASDKYIKSYLTTSNEILESIRNNNYKTSSIRVFLRAIIKIRELFLFNEDKLNKKFKLFEFNFEKKIYEKKTFKILRKIDLLNTKKNFILSGMNLAFLGYYCKKKVYPYKNLFHWPDGIFTKRIINIEKIPGRDIIKKIKLSKKIKSIKIIGNLSQQSKLYLEKKFSLKINHIELPYGPIEELKKFKINLKDSEIIFITLPTPKQEELAYSLSKKNKNYKIICIGGSIAIASGEEKPVPKFLQNYEFLWRLRNDFFRRSFRLLESFYYYVKGNYIKDLYNNTIFRIIEK